MQTSDLLPLSDEFEHIAVYAVLAFFPSIHERRRLIVVVGFGSVALGIAPEHAQFYSGWRDFEICDMVADVAGVCCGLGSRGACVALDCCVAYSGLKGICSKGPPSPLGSERGADARQQETARIFSEARIGARRPRRCGQRHPLPQPVMRTRPRL